MAEEMLGYLIGDAGRIIRRELDERVRSLGVTGPQWLLLARLRRNPGIKQAALADLLEVEPISLSRMIDRLQEAGMVERRADPADRRAWCLFLTDKVKPMLEQIYAVAEDMHVELLAGISDEEQNLMRDILARIVGNISPEPEMRKAANG